MNKKDIRLIIFSLVLLLISLFAIIFFFNKYLNKGSDSEASVDELIYYGSYKKQTYSSSFELIKEEENYDYYVTIDDDVFAFCDIDNDCYNFKFKKETITSDKDSVSSYVPVDDYENTDDYFIAIDSDDGLGNDIIQITKREDDGNYVIIYLG